MTRLMLLCAVVALLALPVLAANAQPANPEPLPTPAVATTAPAPETAASYADTTTPATAPTVLGTPLRGVVTLPAENGQFYINLGTYDRLRQGTDVLLLRNGSLIGRARVVSVSMLDARIALAPESRTLRINSGDGVLVQFNQTEQKQAHRVQALERELMNGRLIIALGIIGLVMSAAK